MKLFRFTSFKTPALVGCVLLGAALSVPAVTLYTPPSAGLVGWWRGEGDATDSSGNGHDGTLLGGMTFTPGVFGQAFDGFTGRRVLIPDGPAFELTSSLSIGAWMNMSLNSWAVLFRGDARPGLDPWALSGDAQGTMGFQIGDATGAGERVSTPIPLNQWVQVTGTLDGSTGDMRLYLNGALVSQTFTSIRPFGPLDPNQGPGVAIGNTTPSHEFPFDGFIDEVVLYNRALSPAEVMSLVPEPGSATLMLCGLGVLLARKIRRGRS